MFVPPDVTHKRVSGFLVLQCAADELAMESTTLFAEEDLTPTAMVPGLRALDSALEGLAADVAAAAAAAAAQEALPPPPQPVPEVTFFKEPPRHSYAGKSLTRQRPSLDLIVSRLFSQRAAIEAANKAASTAATLLDENSNLADALLHDCRSAAQGEQEAHPGPGASQDGEPGLADLYALTAAALDAQLPNSLVCAICLESFENREGLLRHVEDEVRGLNKQAKTPKQRLRPREQPRRNPPPEAPTSPRKRPVRAVTKKAAKVEPPPPPPPPPTTTRWNCTHCRGSYPKRAELRDHIAAEHKEVAEKPHECPVCQKRFARRAHLEQHQLVHSDERPFQCGHCGLSFRRKDRLVVHVRTHTPRGAVSRDDAAKPLVTVHKPKRPASPAADVEEAATCLTCSKTFPIKSRLRRHVLSVHAGTMPHVCLTCGKDCTSKKRLLAHVARHIADRVRTFRCTECGDVLDDKRSLLRHRRSRHGDSHPGGDTGAPSIALSTKASSSTPAATLPSKAPPSRASRVSSSRAATSGVSIPGAPISGTSISGASISGPSSSGTSTSSTSSSSARARSNPVVKEPAIKSPQKFVFKIVSKNGSSHSANMAAKLLPALASDFASKRSGDSKSPSKVVYMVMSKNSNAATTGTAGAADKPGSKVVLKITKKVPSLVPRTPPKVGFKVVSKVVHVDHPTLKEESRSAPAYQDAIHSVNPVHRPPTPTAWPTPALRSLPGVTPLYDAHCQDAHYAGVPPMGVPSMGAPPMGAPYGSLPSVGIPFVGVPSIGDASAPSMGAPYQDALYMNTPHQDAPLLGAPFVSAPYLGDPYLGAPSDARTPSAQASFLDPPVLGAPEGDPSLNVPQGPWNRGSRPKQVRQFPAPTDGRFLCDMCGRRFMSKSLYVLHLQAHGKAVKTFECQCCGQRYLDKEVLRAHWQTHM